LDTRTYYNEFPGGRSDNYTTNVIADNIYAQCGADGRQNNLMEGIIDRNTDGYAVDHADMYIKHRSKKQVSKTTKCWHLCIDWIDGTNTSD
jgi:hypothetical protein